MLEKGINIRTFHESIPHVLCDLNQIAQVILHIVTNARDAMEEDGGTLSIQSRQERSNVVIEISDTGIGIEEEILKNIFDPFVTTKGPFGGGHQPGKGLGLSVAYGIIKNHGGNIKIKSKVGIGTTVSLHLPVDKSGKKQSSSSTSNSRNSDTLLANRNSNLSAL